jgi:hypothetical protein
MNTQRPCYNILDENIDNAFKISDNPSLVGWNPAMELCKIFDQLKLTNGWPTPAALLQNDMLLQSIYSPQDAPKVLFRQRKDYQEVQILGKDPYMPQQLLNNAMHLLLQCDLYTHKFDNLDRKVPVDKIWMNLKTFIQETHTRHLNTTSITTRSQGYI